MRISLLLIACFLISACSLKQDFMPQVDLKAQTLMFSQKYKIATKKLNAVVTLSYLNPVLEKQSTDDVFVLVLTPNSFKVDSLEVFVNQRKATIEHLEKNDALLSYIFKNDFSRYFKITLQAKKDEAQAVAKICLNSLPCFELNFQKYPKSLYYRSVDVDTQYN